jgi:HPt (histidine-containing phosphotransfer) domain-containing protein
LLLYNQRKEFVGIDEDDLSGLGFQNIGELQNESHDFADLFVKKPGYIHNFKNFSWIDFILHSESDESKAVIHAKGRNYSCTLHVTPFHFTSEDSGFAVIIKNLRALQGSENLQATQALESSGGIQASPAPTPSAKASEPAPRAAAESHELDISLEDLQVSEPEKSPEASFDLPPEEELSLPSFEESYTQELSEPAPLDIPEPEELDLGLASTENEFGAPIDIDFDAPLSLDDDIMMDTTPEPSIEEEPSFELPEEAAPVKEEAPMLGDYVSSPSDDEHLSELVRSGTYVYEPQIAADELGLPVDLIEEFIGDFIDQAHEFHDDLYASVKTEDFDNVQILSHKLKGVAANLRVEDAFDVLSVVNVSKEPEKILPNLNQFYRIIAKLEGKELPVETAPVAAPAPVSEPEPELEDTDLTIGIKAPEDGPILVDEDVTPLSHDDLSENAPLIVEEDDLYDDLLGTPDSFEEPSISEPVEAAPMEDDLYDDLLGAPDDFSEPGTFAQTPSAPAIEEDDLYDDLLGNSDEISTEVEAAPVRDVPTLNIDETRTANELGIPVDIVKDFIQDFKEQVATHKTDFDNAVAAQDIGGINKTATLLKGMSDNLRLNEISEVLKQLQQENNINNTAEALATLQAYADQL